jgi:hypothetical protein
MRGLPRVRPDGGRSERRQAGQQLAPDRDGPGEAHVAEPVVPREEGRHPAHASLVGLFAPKITLLITFVILRSRAFVGNAPRNGQVLA